MLEAVIQGGVVGGSLVGLWSPREIWAGRRETAAGMFCCSARDETKALCLGE